VGIAVSVGIVMFNDQLKKAHQREILAQMNSLVTEAIVYKKCPDPPEVNGSFLGYSPPGSEAYSNHIGSPANSGAMISTNDVNYFIELWAEGAFPQRIKIIASSKIYGEGNYWQNTYNARIVASYDAQGKLLGGSTNPNQKGLPSLGIGKNAKGESAPPSLLC
jgi:hypothetical protein